MNCVELVYPKERWGAFHPHRCQRKGVIERDGKTYCKIHDPEVARIRSEKAAERFMDQARTERRKHEDATVGRWLREHEPERYEQILKGPDVK